MSKDPQYSTPAIPASSATFVAHASLRINSPAALVFRTLRNTETWKDWNRFIPKVTIRHQPDETDASQAEYYDLVMLSTSQALNVDSDIASSLPPLPVSRRPSTVSNSSSAGKTSLDGQNQRRASTVSNASTGSKNKHPDTVPSIAEATEMAPEVVPVAPEPPLPPPPAFHGTLLPPPGEGSPFMPGVATKRGSIAAGAKPAKLSADNAAARARRQSLNAIFGEPSVRLLVGTKLTLHTCFKLPTHPLEHKDYLVVVTEVSRPDDPLHPEDSHFLTRSTTHTPSATNVYRIVWGSDANAAGSSKLAKWSLQFQRVTEIRSVYRGDGKEEAEIKTWEGWKGLQSKKIDHKYVQKWLEKTLEGLRDFCESFGGAVDRRDFMEVL